MARGYCSDGLHIGGHARQAQKTVTIVEVDGGNRTLLQGLREGRRRGAADDAVAVPIQNPLWRGRRAISFIEKTRPLAVRVHITRDAAQNLAPVSARSLDDQRDAGPFFHNRKANSNSEFTARVSFYVWDWQTKIGFCTEKRRSKAIKKRSLSPKNLTSFSSLPLCFSARNPIFNAPVAATAPLIISVRAPSFCNYNFPFWRTLKTSLPSCKCSA